MLVGCIFIQADILFTLQYNRNNDANRQPHPLNPKYIQMDDFSVLNKVTYLETSWNFYIFEHWRTWLFTALICQSKYFCAY